MGRPGVRRPARSPRSADPEAVARRRQRAAEEPLDVRLRAREPYVDLEVRNPIHRTSYRVLFPSFPLRDAALCTCTDFARRGLGTCKHLEAAWEWLQSGAGGTASDRPPEATPEAPSTWEEIDRRLDRLARSEPGSIREVEQAGAALWSPREAEDDAEERGTEGVRRSRPARPVPTSTSRARP